MATSPLPEPAPAGPRLATAPAAVCLGLIGLFLSWLPPYGFTISLVGLLCGLWALLWPAGRTKPTLLWALGGTALSLAGVGLSIFLMPGGFFHI